jgi:hypothetical protein
MLIIMLKSNRGYSLFKTINQVFLHYHLLAPAGIFIRLKRSVKGFKSDITSLRVNLI